jgi:hypothetical protein
LALHPWQITGIIIIDVGVLMAVLIGPFLMVWFIPVGIGLLILGKITEKWILIQMDRHLIGYNHCDYISCAFPILSAYNYRNIHLAEHIHEKKSS